MNLQTVMYERAGPVGVVRLNRPESMNAVIEQMYLDIQAVLDRARGDPEVRALVLTGTVLRREGGDKQAFCAGADLKKHAAGERTPEQRREYILLAHETTRRLYEFKKPVIAAINGPARGAGAEMALSCDFIFMADEATLAFTETGLGTFVGGGATKHLARLVGMARAKELIYTGRVLDGRRAVEIGLALRWFPVKQLLKAAVEFGRELAERAPVSIAFAKELIQKAPERDLEAVLSAETEAILACMDTEDWKEGIASFQERRKPAFKGR
jgi:enoyl-CoA hydratase